MGFSTGTRPTLPNKTSAEPLIPACSLSLASTTTTSSRATKPSSWVPASVTLARSSSWLVVTIRPALLSELAADTGDLDIRLSSEHANAIEAPQDAARISLSEAGFRWAMNEEQMATDKLSDGIRRFAADQVKLETMLEALA